MTARRPWPNWAQWARQDGITLASRIRQELRPIIDADNNTIGMVEIVKRTAKAMNLAAELEALLREADTLPGKISSK